MKQPRVASFEGESVSFAFLSLYQSEAEKEAFIKSELLVVESRRNNGTEVPVLVQEASIVGKRLGLCLCRACLLHATASNVEQFVGDSLLTRFVVGQR